MFSENYIEYVKKTANPEYTLEMAACALMEEFNEFDSEPSIDELGDVYYQFVLFAYLTGIDLKDINYVDGACDNVQTILDITSQFKKLKTRGKQLDLTLISNKLKALYSDIIDATDVEGLTIDEVEKYNIDKLNARYGNVNE